MAVSRLHPSPPPPTQHQHQQHHHHHIASTLMSCVRESSPVEELEDAAEDPSECGAGGGAESRKQGRHESKKRRFHPLRELRRIFRIKSRRSPEDGDRDVIPQSSTVASSYGPSPLTRDEGRDPGGTAAAYGDLDEAYRSRSASELLSGEEDEEEEESPGGRRRGSGGIASGDLFQDSLRHSVSHDSVFSSGERRVSSGGGGGGGSGGRPILPLAPSSSAQQVAAHQGVRAELFDAVRRRRWRSRSKDRDEDNEADRETGEAGAANRSSDDEEDLGLPRSPCNSPSSGEAGLRSDQKEIQSKSHSTCSEGSLVSMGSSDMDEDSQGHFSGHSSKLSLQERSSSQYGSDFELDVGATAEPLSHSAARHKMSVRPKRTHGAPRPRRLKEVTSLGSLPTTPEVNEDSGRCSSPEVSFNQETSSSEHIQVPSDCQAKNVPMSSAIDMPQRHPQGRQVAASPKSDPPLSCLPDNFEPTATEASATLAREPLMAGDKEESKEAVEEVTKQESGRGTSEFSESNHGGVEEEMEESEGGSTTLLSRILSWRGSKKKIEEPQEASFAAPAEGTPARRMDVHGRYVHEVICETEVTSPGMDQPPPSPAWRSPFATSWPPLHHSTPRSCHSSTRYIPPGRGDDQLDSSTSPDWGSGLSGPHSLPLMMQFETMEKSVTDGRFLESHTPADLSSSSNTRMPSQMDDFGFNSSSFNAFKAGGSTILSSSDAPESLPVSFNKASFEPEHPVPTSDRLVKVNTKDVCSVEKGSPQKETFLMTSVEGLLTLDLSRPSEVSMHDTSEEESSGNFEVDNNVPEIQEEWEEPPKVTEESLHFNSCISVPDEGNVFSVENSEPKVMLHHTRLERNAEELHRQRSEESLKIDGTPEVSYERVNDQQDELPNLAKTTSPNSQRYKRTQSLPVGATLTQPPDVPEFLRVQLIHVDSRPTTNVVLHSAGGVPVSVNPPETSETPGRRRMRPRSADSLDSNQSGSKESDQILPAGNTRVADNVLTVDNESDSGSIKEKEVPREGKCKISTWEPASKVTQSDDIKTKDTALPRVQQKKMHEEIPDKVVNVPVTPTKEKVEFTDIFQKALLRDCSEIILSDDAKLKDNSTPVKAQKKPSGDSVTKTGVPITSMKDREEGKLKVTTKEPLGTAAVDNKIRDASLPPKAQRKISEDSTTEVVTRRKSSSKDLTSQNKDEEPELFKVFARRSLKLKDSEAWENHPPGQQQKSRDSDKENEVGENVMDVMILPTNKEQKHRDSVGKGEFLKEIDPQGKSFASDGTPQLQKIPSSNGLLPSSSISSLQSVFNGDKVVDNPKTHRSSIGGSLPRREGPSPEKRPRGISLNLPPESHPFRGAIVTGEQQRRPLWAAQIQPDESYGRTAEVANQTIDLGFRGEEEVKPHFKGIQQRKEEWELRARMQ